MSVQGITKLTDWDRKTVRKYLLRPNVMPEYGPRRKRARKADPFQFASVRPDTAGVGHAQVL
jgi:hypothetical protein